MAATGNTDTSSPPPRASSLRRAILSLGLVNMLDMAIQVALPMILVRLLSEIDFGEYRLLWLLASTALAVLPMAMPNSLFYFLPRSAIALRSAYLMQAALFMLAAAAVALLGTWLWGSFSTHRISQLLQVAAFVAIWLFACLLDVMFSAQQRGPTQAAINLTFAILRLLLIAGSAWLTHSFAGVLIAHLLLASAKALLCAILVWRQVAATGLHEVNASRWREQWRFAAPFGASNGLYLLRGRIDQWLVAALFSAAQFGLYSIAAVFSPIQGLIRSTINNVVLPEMAQLQASANRDRMFELNQRGNLAVALIMFPTLAFLFAMAPMLLTILFRAEYAAAAPVVRIYCIVLLIEAIEVTMLLTSFRQGRFMMTVDAIVLILSVAVSLLAAKLFGLPGAAAGAAVGALVAQAAAYQRCARLTERRLGEQQDWSGLARILLSAATAALVSWISANALAERALWAALIACSLTFTASYWVLLRIVGLTSVIRGVFGVKLARWAAF
jgi:O-antigen/teichoic acid export membrane protein